MSDLDNGCVLFTCDLDNGCVLFTCDLDKGYARRSVPSKSVVHTNVVKSEFWGVVLRDEMAPVLTSRTLSSHLSVTAISPAN